MAENPSKYANNCWPKHFYLAFTCAGRIDSLPKSQSTAGSEGETRGHQIFAVAAFGRVFPGFSWPVQMSEIMYTASGPVCG